MKFGVPASASPMSESAPADRLVPVAGPIALPDSFAGEPAHEAGMAESLGVLACALVQGEAGLQVADVAFEVGEDATALSAEGRADLFGDRDAAFELVAAPEVA